MSSAVTTPDTHSARASIHRKSVFLVFCCTILGAAAQVLMKSGANQLVSPGLLGILTNIPLMTGYTLYGLSTVLLVLALKDGELSLLYPVIALTYVWVTVLSILIFHDKVNAFRIAGVAIIVLGVAVLGRSGRE